jgi:general stress protein YciG
MAQKSLRGFAAMDPAKQRAIASKGGRAAHAKGTAHEFTPEEARAAGRKGGQAAHAKGTAHEFTPEEAREAGRKGGQSAHTGQNAGEQGQADTHTMNPDVQPMPVSGTSQPIQTGMPQPMEPIGAFTGQSTNA